MKNVIIFGASGSIGNFIFNSLDKKEYNIIGTSSSQEKCIEGIVYVTNDFLDNLKSINKIDIIIWTQGHNFNDNIQNFNYSKFQQIIDINVSFILNTLQSIVDKINNGGKLVIISSIWEEFTRENKLSYSISKSSLSGLVKNLACNLSSRNILVNNVLPGVIDNEMTITTLDEEKLEYLKNYTNFNRLVTLEDVYETVLFLVSKNTGITGQSIKVDLGFTNIHNYR